MSVLMHLLFECTYAITFLCSVIQQAQEFFTESAAHSCETRNVCVSIL